jgi:hypothetical protein
MKLVSLHQKASIKSCAIVKHFRLKAVEFLFMTLWNANTGSRTVAGSEGQERWDPDAFNDCNDAQKANDRWHVNGERP